MNREYQCSCNNEISRMNLVQREEICVCGVRHSPTPYYRLHSHSNFEKFWERSFFFFTMITIDDITSIIRYLNSIIGIILFIFGVVGCISNFILFTRRRLFSTPCSQYILAAALLDFILLITNLSSRIATEGFAVSNGFLFTVGVCKIRTWLVPWLGAASLTCKALSSFDQWACTSRSARFRIWSSVNRARLLIVFSTLLWSFPSLPFMIYMDMIKVWNLTHSFSVIEVTEDPLIRLFFLSESERRSCLY
jgi:hypothetical protein